MPRLKFHNHRRSVTKYLPFSRCPVCGSDVIHVWASNTKAIAIEKQHGEDGEEIEYIKCDVYPNEWYYCSMCNMYEPGGFTLFDDNMNIMCINDRLQVTLSVI